AALVREAPDRHVFVFTAHHLLVDGWSSAVVFGDLAKCYAADRFGIPPALPPAAPYRDFVERQSSPAVAAEMKDALDYFAAQYAAGVPSFELPLDRARPPLKTYNAGRQVLAIEKDLYRAVRTMAAKQGATPFVALLATFEVLVARLASADDIVIGVPMASQALEDNGHLVAHGVNTIPLRCRVDPGQPFTEHLRAARRAFLDAQAHPRLTFGTLVHKLRLPRNPGRTPLVEVVFNIDKLGSPFDFGEVRLTSVDAPKAFYNFELGINAIDDGESLVVECDYNADLFDGTTIARWLAHYRELLRGVAADPATRVADLPMEGAAGSPTLVAGPSTGYDGAPTGSFLDLVEAQAKSTPERIATDDGTRTLAYAALWSESARIAQALIASGVSRGELVGLCAPRSVGMLAGLLGILRAGCAYVPLDRTFPDRRLHRMIERANLRRMVIGGRSDLPAAVAASGATFIDVSTPGAASSTAQLPEVRGDDPAYVLFTSGSTGEPKGVRVLHRNLVNFLVSMRESPGLAADDVLCAVTTLSFDIAGLEMYLPLVAGARVRIASEDECLDPRLLARVLRDSRTTVLQTTPTLLRMLVESGEADCLAGLRLLVGGEAMPRDLANLVAGRCRALWNMYGPTETTIWSALYRVPSETETGPLPLGGPIANTSIYILDRERRPVPAGVRGEIWIGGDGVADGYLGNAELTTERFVADPFAAGRRMYRTGDVGSVRDGILHFHGRADDQVKLRGFRIELGDIEAAALEEPRVREAAATVRELGPNDTRLLLFVVARDDASDLPDALNERLRDALPPYMRPNHIVVVDALARTANGKIDRKALRFDETNAKEGAAGRTIVAPRSPTEKLVVAAFARELHREDIGVHDDFFELGGHSLMAARIIARLRAEANVDLPLRNLFERPTPEGLAGAIDALAWLAHAGRASAPGAGDREEIEL
ncbi:MAG TPA: amino acid adenylation domain-containing protein, partial [Rhodanobacteraceae bacterium]|nr:amino acid adenylation domain-containing protein [Rhodanobacteraceae bacterium]